MLFVSLDVCVRKVCCHPEQASLVAICFSNGKVSTYDLNANGGIDEVASSNEQIQIQSSNGLYILNLLFNLQFSMLLSLILY